MNKQILTLTLVSLLSDHDKEGKLTVTGYGEFEWKVARDGTTSAIVELVATGKPALALIEAGEGNRVLVTGRLKIEPPTETDPNHALSLIVQEVELLGEKPAPARSIVKPISKPTANAAREKAAASLGELASFGI
jgi:hypothetical protein